MSSLYILNINPLYNIWLAKFFSYSFCFFCCVRAFEFDCSSVYWLLLVLFELMVLWGVTEARVWNKRELWAGLGDAAGWAGAAPGKGKRARQVVKQNGKTQQKSEDRKLRKCSREWDEKTKMEDREARKTDILCLQWRRSRGPDGQQRGPQARARPHPTRTAAGRPRSTGAQGCALVPALSWERLLFACFFGFLIFILF